MNNVKFVIIYWHFYLSLLNIDYQFNNFRKSSNLGMLINDEIEL